jgi:Tol biopolymer transport system component
LVRENAVSIWEIRSDGTDLHRVFPDWEGSLSEHAGVWTTDGRYYLFLAKHGRLTEIWALREGSGILQRRSGLPVKLATGPLSWGQMAPGPDGKKLYVNGYDERGELVRYDSTSHQFVPYLSGISAGELDYSRDGNWVTYVSYPEGAIWKSRIDGSERVQLTYPPIDAVLPRWSPDGTEIAFVDEERGKPWRILLVSADGGTPTEAYPEKQGQVDPTWSPDGKKLVFGRVPVSGSTNKMDINILDLSSHQISAIPTSENLFSPRWSPDGEHVLAMTEDSKKLVSYDLKKHEWSDWINEPGAIGFPVWSRDGRYVYYDRVSTSQPSFRRVRVGENQSELLIDLKDLPRYFSPIGPWSGLTPDGSALFVRNLSTDEIYALDLELP